MEALTLCYYSKTWLDNGPGCDEHSNFSESHLLLKNEHSKGINLVLLLGPKQKAYMFIIKCFFIDVHNSPYCSTLLKMWRISKQPGGQERNPDVPSYLVGSH